MELEATAEPISPEKSFPRLAMKLVAERLGVTAPAVQLNVRLGGRTFALISNWMTVKNVIRVKGFDLKATLSPRPIITLRSEGPRDEQGKSLGLNREVQTGDPSFDGKVYIESFVSDAAVLETLGNSGVRQAVVNLLASGVDPIQIGPDGVSAHVKRELGPDASFDPDAVIPMLQAFGRLIVALPPATLEIPKQKSVGAVGCIPIGVVVLSPLVALGLHIASWASRDSTGIVGYRPFIVGTAFGAGAAAIVTLLFYFLGLLRPTSTGFRAFVARAILIWVVFVLAGAPGVLLIDRYGGLSKPKKTDVMIRSLQVSKSEWHMTVDSWNREGDTETFELDEFIGIPGQRARLTIQRGALGFEWVTAGEKLSTR